MRAHAVRGHDRGRCGGDSSSLVDDGTLLESHSCEQFERAGLCEEVGHRDGGRERDVRHAAAAPALHDHREVRRRSIGVGVGGRACDDAAVGEAGESDAVGEIVGTVDRDLGSGSSLEERLEGCAHGVGGGRICRRDSCDGTHGDGLFRLCEGEVVGFTRHHDIVKDLEGHIEHVDNSLVRVDGNDLDTVGDSNFDEYRLVLHAERVTAHGINRDVTQRRGITQLKRNQATLSSTHLLIGARGAILRVVTLTLLQRGQSACAAGASIRIQRDLLATAEQAGATASEVS